MTSTSPQASRFSVSQMLLQPPRKWTRSHLHALNLKDYGNVPAAEIVGDENLPSDGEGEFETLASQFCKPTKEELLGPFYYIDKNYPGIFAGAFFSISRRLNSTEESTYSLKTTLSNLVDDLCREIQAGQELSYYCTPKFHFDIPTLNVRGSLKCDAAVVKYNGSKAKVMSIPLIILSVMRGPGLGRIARHIVPQALLQAILAYNQNPHLDHYSGFVVSADQAVLQVSRVVASRTYMKNLCEGKPSRGGDLVLYHSNPMDVLEQDGRRQFLRLIMGLLRFLRKSEVYTLIGEYLP